jgi:serine/threonine protein kinase/Tfp pilus assembly protein PilF
MNEPTDDEGAVPSPEQVDEALAAFWRGSSLPFDRLLDDEGDISVCSVLKDVIRTLPDQCLSGPMNEAYTVIREIGRGGMGLVYEARQERTARNVAIKIMQHAAPTDEASARLFRREVEILAGLKHPYIATLHDAGQTQPSLESAGQPFFVMELVEGQPLTRWSAELDRSGSSSRTIREARLRLFCKICEAVNYAHQRGVIHRDLKPGNILVVADQLQDSIPKLLDFGLASLPLEQSPGENGDRTCVGTPAYMSPEQKEGRSQDVDTRSDIYALGVILHEMLTGSRPDTKPSRAAALPADLQLIMVKSLSHDRAARYQSASEFSSDIDHFLKNLPISARQPSASYQLRKLISRHRLSATLGILLMTMLAVFGGVFIYQARQVTIQRDAARLEARRAQELNAYLSGMFDSMDPESVGANVPVRELLDRAAAELASGLTSDDQVRASLHDTIGRGYLTLRVLDRSEDHLNAALEIRKRLYGENHLAFAQSLHQLGMLALRQHRAEFGMSCLKRAGEIRRQLSGDQSLEYADSLCDMAIMSMDRAEYSEAQVWYRNAVNIQRVSGASPRVLAETLRSLGAVLVASGRFEEALPVLEEALTLQRNNLGRDHFEVAHTLIEIIEIHQHYAEFQIAEQLCREQVRILRKLFPEGHKYLAGAISELALLLEENSRFVEAESLHREACEMELRIEGEDSLTLNNYAGFLREQGRYSEAEPLCRRVRQLWCTWGPQETVHPGVAYAAQNLGLVLIEQGCLDEAENCFQRAIAAWQELFAEQNPKIANALIGLGRIYEHDGNYAAAEACFWHAARVREQRLGATNPLTALANMHLARALSLQSRPEAIGLGEEALAQLHATYGSRHRLITWGNIQLGQMYQRTGDFDHAAGMFRDAIEIERQMQPPKESLVLQAKRGLMQVYRKAVPVESLDTALGSTAKPPSLPP